MQKTDRRLVFGLKTIAIVTMFLGVVPLSSSAEEIRVAIQKNVEAVTAISSGAISVDGKCGNTSPLFFKNNVSVRPDRLGFYINNAFISCNAITLSSFLPIEVNKKEYDGKIDIVRVSNKKTHVINVVDIENYVAGVIEKEMDPSWPMEALKAQAVASRSFALYRKKDASEKLYDVESTTTSQVYGGLAVSPRSQKAVDETKGMVAVYDGEIAETLFHAVAGGETENLTNVWAGEGKPYLISRPARFETDSPYYNWKTTLSAQELYRKLLLAGYKVGSIRSIQLSPQVISGRVRSVAIRHSDGNLKLKATDFRKIVGNRKIRSTRFSFTHNIKKGIFMFRGIGYGHGVGMSQWSARGMAKKGANYSGIITHFYPGVTLNSRINEFEMAMIPSLR